MLELLQYYFITQNNSKKQIWTSGDFFVKLVMFMANYFKGSILTVTQVFKDRIFIYLILANLFVLGLIWYFWLAKISPSGYQIYTQFYLSGKREVTVLLPPIFASLVFAVNLILGIFSRKREALASYLVIGSSIFVLGLILILVRHYLSLI